MKARLGLGLILSWSLLTGSSQAAQPADDTIAKVHSLQGLLHVRINETTIYQIQKPSDLRDQAIKSGWTISTDKNSRCNLELRDRSIITLGPYSTVSFHKKDRRILTRLARGILSFFHRDEPGELEIEGPEVAAVIYGTEFVFRVDADGKTTLTLYDGRVEMSGGLTLNSGDVAVAEPGQPPRKTAVVNWRSLDAIQWCLYYPAILDLDEVGLDADTCRAISASVEAYRTGDLLAALAAYPEERKPVTAAEQVFFASLLLSVGNVTESESLLGNLDRDEIQGRLARALLQLVAVVRRQTDVDYIRMSDGTQALAATDLLATEDLARSYRQQAHGDLEAARESARQAVQRSPAFGFAWARLGELEFSFGNIRPARQAVDRALRLTPRNAQAHALRGFLLCAQDRIREAHDAFDRALELDPALGNAWLGRGLCRMRQGDIAGGRADMQTAAAVEPQRALLRSYLAKAFSKAGQGSRAVHELRLAQAIDPLDPTAWLYSALIKFNQNRVNEAIADLEESKRLNDQRYVYRSRLMLDQDRAVRGANLAAFYQDAGMAEVAVREAARAVESDYANASAHAFLANAYDAFRDPRLVNLRYEAPWLNELLLANLLAPVGATLLSQNVSQQEYSRLFERDRIGLLSTTEYTSNGDWWQTASQYGSIGPLSYALDLDYRDENGQRPNEDRTSTAFYAKVKYQLTPQDSLLFMANTLDYDAGDLRQYYDPASASRSLRVAEAQSPNLYLGYHREWYPGSHTLFLVGWMDDNLRLRDPDSAALVLKQKGSSAQPYVLGPVGLQYERQLNAYSAELQQIWQTGRHTLIAGGRYQAGSPEIKATLRPPNHPWFGSILWTPSIESDLERGTLYVYDQWEAFDSFQLQGGLSYDYLNYPLNIEWPPYAEGQGSTDQFSPKAGFTWRIATNTFLHGAWTRSLGGVYYDTSLRLEPTHIAGFNQTYRSLIPESAPSAAGGLIPGAQFETWGIGFDHRFPSRTYVGIEGQILQEEAKRMVAGFQSVFPQPAVPFQTPQRFDYTESSLAITLNQLVGRAWGFAVGYRMSLADLITQYPWLPPATQKYSSVPLDTDGDALLHELRLAALFNHPRGFFAQFAAHWHSQDNGGDYASLADDSFWQLDAFIGYRFWQRRATAQVGLLNITDQDYRLNPLNLYQELPRERTFVAQLKLCF